MVTDADALVMSAALAARARKLGVFMVALLLGKTTCYTLHPSKQRPILRLPSATKTRHGMTKGGLD
jgi:hypothetical protein